MLTPSANKARNQFAASMRTGEVMADAPLPQAVLDFDQFLNEPPEYEDLRRVREYRSSAYPKWLKVLSVIKAHLPTARPSQSDDEIERLRSIYNKTYFEGRLRGDGGGDAERQAMRAVLESTQPAQPQAVRLLALLAELKPLAAYGVVGSRDVDQARYQAAIAAIEAELSTTKGGAA